MSKTYRVVIADDEPDSRVVLRNYLVQAGHLVMAEAQSVEELIQHCMAAPPELIITDTEMGGIDGLSAIKKVSDAHGIPVIIVAARFDEKLIERAISCRVFGYLIKPIRANDVTAAVAIAMQQFEEFQLLREDASRMRQALDDRKIIERAKGIVMRKCGLDEASAFQRLQDTARHDRQKLIDVARGIVLAEEVLDQISGDNRKLEN